MKTLVSPSGKCTFSLLNYISPRVNIFLSKLFMRYQETNPAPRWEIATSVQRDCHYRHNHCSCVGGNGRGWLGNECVVPDVLTVVFWVFFLQTSVCVFEEPFSAQCKMGEIYIYSWVHTATLKGLPQLQCPLWNIMMSDHLMSIKWALLILTV